MKALLVFGLVAASLVSAQASAVEYYARCQSVLAAPAPARHGLLLRFRWRRPAMPRKTTIWWCASRRIRITRSWAFTSSRMIRCSIPATFRGTARSATTRVATISASDPTLPRRPSSFRERAVVCAGRVHGEACCWGGSSVAMAKACPIEKS